MGGWMGEVGNVEALRVTLPPPLILPRPFLILCLSRPSVIHPSVLSFFPASHAPVSVYPTSPRPSLSLSPHDCLFSFLVCVFLGGVNCTAAIVGRVWPW